MAITFTFAKNLQLKPGEELVIKNVEAGLVGRYRVIRVLDPKRVEVEQDTRNRKARRKARAAKS